jgi:hypothetical protein
MTKNERVQHAEKLKEAGNRLYQLEKYRSALRKYHRALLYCLSYPRQDIDAKDQPELEEKIPKIQATLHLNLAAVNLKMRDFESAIESCDSV